MWRKEGRIFHLDDAPNRSNHTQVPTLLMKGGVARVYYACRNNGNSFPAFVDIDRNNLSKVVRVHEKPIMDTASPGMFDSDGVMPGCIVSNGEELWMYYTGWNSRSNGARYHNAIGLAVSTDGGETFQRKFSGPILDRTPQEHGMAVTPFVLKEGNIWKMWYSSGVSWKLVGNKYEPIYVIKYARSFDGIVWGRPNIQCLKVNGSELAFNHPCVVKRDDCYHMWYCYRSSEDYRDGIGSYRIGYAKSLDGIEFERSGDPLEKSSGGWDSTMMCYPFVTEINEKLVMFYNGNSFGQTGIGYAVND